MRKQCREIWGEIMKNDVLDFIKLLVDDRSKLAELGDIPTSEMIVAKAREEGFSITGTDFCRALAIIDAIIKKAEVSKQKELTEEDLAQVAGGLTNEELLSRMPVILTSDLAGRLALQNQSLILALLK
jgi:predicted ribosomally synthesized peptide with nif11-like leader